VPAQLARGGEKLGSDDIARMSTKDLAAAAPSDIRFLLIPSVESIARGVGELGKTIDIKLSGRLVDLSDGRELWRDTAEGDADLSGLLTVLTGPAPRQRRRIRRRALAVLGLCPTVPSATALSR
jgi:hypothetical protein